MTRHFLLFACLLGSKALAQKPPAVDAANTPSENRFEIRNIEGWTVFINRSVTAQYPAELAATLNHLKWELYQTKLAVPSLAVTNMQEKNAIWIEYKEEVDLSYHPDRSWLIEKGYTIPKDQKSFMSLSVATHLGDSYRHPFVVFHEFAHGFDYHFIGAGFNYGNNEAQANYEQMMKEGKYEKVKIWDGSIGSHYARTNRMEYWAESSEAYCAVNDIYPFVRAELREHDPRMARFVERYWGINPEEVVKMEQDLVTYQQQTRKTAPGSPIPNGGGGATGEFIPSSKYDKRQIDGWTVYISPRLTAQPGICASMVTLLNYKLHMINHFIGAEGRRQLHEVPIWLETGQPGPYVRYCASKEQLAAEKANPDKLNSVEVRNPQTMMKWALLQQSDMLHEIALAYFDRHAGKETSALGGKVHTAYEQAGKDGRYGSVLRFDGQRVPHPAMISEKEYFSELMESYFLTNDHYPFIRCELKDHDPAGYQLIAGLWEGNPRR